MHGDAPDEDDAEREIPGTEAFLDRFVEAATREEHDEPWHGVCVRVCVCARI